MLLLLCFFILILVFFSSFLHSTITFLFFIFGVPCLMCLKSSGRFSSFQFPFFYYCFQARLSHRRISEVVSFMGRWSWFYVCAVTKFMIGEGRGRGGEGGWGGGGRRARLKMACVFFFFFPTLWDVLFIQINFVLLFLINIKIIKLLFIFSLWRDTKKSSTSCARMCIHQYLHARVCKYMWTFIYL